MGTSERQWIALVLVIGLIVTGCASGGAKGSVSDPTSPAGQQLLRGTYQGLKQARDIAVDTGKQFSALCPTGRISAATCRGWNEFLPKFQDGYTALAKAWETAAPGGTQALADATASLVGEILMYAFMVGTQPKSPASFVPLPTPDAWLATLPALRCWVARFAVEVAQLRPVTVPADLASAAR